MKQSAATDNAANAVGARGLASMANTRSYVLVTPTKNEESCIGITIECVLNQTQLPAEWLIVSDGSTDRTNEIVQRAAARHPWIRLLHMPARETRDFASVVRATEAGVKALTADHRYIGLLDSDVRFQSDYFATLIDTFESAPKLGLGGGVVIDVGCPRDRLPRNRQDVPGAVQFFRRECFESLGGLIAIPEGGWDGLTCARARMNGYETRLVTSLVVDHLKPRNVSQGGLLRRNWQMGVRDYAVGCHPLFELAKCFARVFERPALVGSIAWGIGYGCGALQRREHPIPRELFIYLREEQMKRIWGLLGDG